MGPEILDALAAARQFCSGRVTGVRRYGAGNVHETYLACPEGQPAFILQRVNTRVFPRPELVGGNVRAVTEHMEQKLRTAPLGDGRRWEVPTVLLARDGRDRWIDAGGSVWRATRFVEAAHSRETVRDTREAAELGWALGAFHSLVSDLPAERLADTLKGFHVTPLYLRRYQALPKMGEGGEGAEIGRCRRFVQERSSTVHLLEEARAQGRLRWRPIHGDPKVDNVLFDDVSGRAVGVVDLDTVKPGLVHYDIGDCLRSGCNPLGEETDRWGEVRFEPALCRAILEGYASEARGFLTEDDYEHVYDAVRLIAFELGLRFFIDHLEGDVYFRTTRHGHNLARALVQFQLTESIEAQESTIRTIVREVR